MDIVPNSGQLVCTIVGFNDRLHCTFITYYINCMLPWNALLITILPRLKAVNVFTFEYITIITGE